MNNYIHVLQSLNLFSNITSNQLLTYLTRDSYMINKYKRNSIIFFKNEECKSCSILLEGSIVIQDIDMNGNILTLNKFSAGDILGENLLFSNSNTYPMNVLSYTDTTVLHIKKELILKLCKEDDHFLENFLYICF